MTKYTFEDLIKYRIQKAKETINEVETLIKNQLWNTAINRMYYSCYYAVSALLLKHGIQTSTHSGIRQKFGQHFINTGIIEKRYGKHYSELFEKRQKGDYDDFVDFDELPRGKPRSIRIISVVLQIFSHRSFLDLQRIS